jgi:hypothetical protein
VLILDMIQVHPPLGKYKYDTWRILLVKCYIDNSVRLRSCIRNVNILKSEGQHIRGVYNGVYNPKLGGMLKRTLTMWS